ncbi:CDP-glycerol glycerophosphotransferase family protein, partial [Gammaproteobacteria bacterium]|nr:CDP-glycerol glycerophosphotransferase family protein [Gammaproteobacteria bacterium]
GQYLLNLDGDDWIAENACEQLVHSAQKYNADIVQPQRISTKTTYSNGYRKLVGSKNVDRKNRFVADGEQIFDSIIRWNRNPNIYAGISGKLIRRELWAEAKPVLLDKHPQISEDLFITLGLASRATKVVAIDSALYFWRIRSSSLSRTVNDSYILEICGNIDRLTTITGIPELYLQQITERYFIHMICGVCVDKISTIKDSDERESASELLLNHIKLPGNIDQTDACANAMNIARKTLAKPFDGNSSAKPDIFSANSWRRRASQLNKDRAVKYFLYGTSWLCRYVIPTNSRLILLAERNAETATDSAWFLWKYLQSAKSPFNAVYVAKADVQIQTNGDVVRPHTFRWFWLLHRAGVLGYTDSALDLAHPYPFLLRGKKIFLQHGINAIKKTEYLEKKHVRDISDLVIVSSEREAEFLNSIGYTRDKLHVTGLPRFDAYRVNANAVDLMIAPTWRDYLEEIPLDAPSAANFINTWVEIACHPKVENYCKKYNAKVHLVVHYRNRHLSMAAQARLPDYLHIVEQSAIAFAEPYDDQIVPVHELINQSRALITDYSSLAFNFIYKNSTAIFFIDESSPADFKSFIRLPDELPGTISLTIQHAIDSLTEESGSYTHDHNYFNFHDSRNSQRVMDLLTPLIS